jgi:hypothetical protein
MNVYLVEFSDRMYGFTIRAIVGPSSVEECKKYCEDKFGCQFDKPYLKTYAMISDVCDIMRDRITYCEFGYQE